MTGGPLDARLDAIEDSLRRARSLTGWGVAPFACSVDDVLALVEIARAALGRRCNRFDVQPCSERPEINPEDWCSMCAALARLEGAAE